MGMNKKILVSILILFFYPCSYSQNSTCESTSTYISDSNCTINYSTCTVAQTQSSQFYLDSCWQRVFSRQSDQSQLYETISLTESECSQICCQTSLSNSPFTLQTLNQCTKTKTKASDNTSSSSSSSYTNSVLIISLIIGGTIFLTVVFYIYRNRNSCATCWRKIFCCPNEETNVGNDTHPAANNTHASRTVDQTVAWQKVTDIIDNAELQPSLKYFMQNSPEDVTCCICLDPQPNCFTSCNHQFHVKCLKEWIKKKKTCPLCTTQDFNPLKIICQNCYLKVLYYSVNDAPLLKEISTNKINCDDCSRYRKDFTDTEKHLKTNQQNQI